MSNYQRFITYLFLYENNSKKVNCGFAKVEVRQNVCRIEFHIKNCPGEQRETEVSVFIREGKDLIMIPLGKLMFKNHCSDGIFRFDGIAVGGSGYTFDQIRGILIPLSDSRLIASQWDDEKTDWRRRRHLGSLPESQEETKKPAKEKQSGKNNEENTAPLHEEKVRNGAQQLKEEKEKKLNVHAVSKVEQLMEQEVKKAEKIKEKTENSEEPEKATLKIQSAQPVKNVNIMEEAWVRFKQSYMEIFPFSGDRHVRAVRFDLKDFKMLPKYFWYLRNNSFLLHGYFSYGTLLFGYMEKEGKWFVGVPGVFQNQERVMASIFGFPEFRTQEECIQRTGEFGYWYRYLEIKES